MSHCSAPAGPGLHTPPAVSTSASGNGAFEDAAAPAKPREDIKARSSAATAGATSPSATALERASRAAARCGPTASAQANSVRAVTAGAGRGGGCGPARCAACGPSVCTAAPAEVLRRTACVTKSPSLSSGKPVCSGFKYNTAPPDAACCAAIPADTSVLPTPVLLWCCGCLRTTHRGKPPQARGAPAPHAEGAGGERHSS